MKLSPDISDHEIIDVLKRIWKEYAPGQSSDFLQELSRGQLQMLIDLISTKDPTQREKKWDSVRKSIQEADLAMKKSLQKFRMIRIQVDEFKEKDQDESDMIQLEKQF